MPLDIHAPVGSYDDLIYQLLRAAERWSPVPYDARDHTITIGVDYTLVQRGAQGWARYQFLNGDFNAAGIPLPNQQMGKRGQVRS